MSSLFSHLGPFLGIAAMTTAACAPAGRHQHAHVSHHGPGSSGHHHGNPDDLDSYIAHLEAPERAEWQKPDEVVTKLGLVPGSVACEIGAGSGYFTLRLARAVGESGAVYAVDVEPRMLQVLRERTAKAGLRNVTPILGRALDSGLPGQRCDVVLIVNTLHHLEDPVAYLKGLVPSLKPGGRIVNIDFHKRPTPMGPPLEMRIDRGAMVEMAGRSGLRVSAERDLLPHQYFIELTPR